MPRRDDINKILIIGSGPIIIGQACEFDYSGTQACKALRSLGYEVVLVNSNPATIMTDPGMADVTYIEPLNLKVLTEIIEGQVIPRGYSDEFEMEYTKKGGKTFPVSLRLWVIKDKDGEPIGRWGIVRDITERKKAQESIKKSEKKYSTLLMLERQRKF